MQLLERDDRVARVQAEARVDSPESDVAALKCFVEREHACAGRAHVESRVKDDLPEGEAPRRIALGRGCREGDPVFGDVA